MRRTDEKTLVVGDMHQKQERILRLVDAALDDSRAKRVVLLGDYCDEWNGENRETDASDLLDGLELLVSWVEDVRQRGITCDVLLGNHDMQYVLGEPGPGTNMSCIEEVRRLLDAMQPKVAACVSGCLVTHAGLTQEFASSYLDWESDAAEDAAHALNELWLSGDEDDLHALALCGPGRGGQDMPGPLWASIDELCDDPARGINQIVGHTPWLTCARLKTFAGGGEQVYICDTFSVDSMFRPLGDGSMYVFGGADGVRKITPVDLCFDAW